MPHLLDSLRGRTSMYKNPYRTRSAICRIRSEALVLCATAAAQPTHPQPHATPTGTAHGNVLILPRRIKSHICDTTVR
eukprot:6193524-Pleurochrysis_carterae.AAC.1